MDVVHRARVHISSKDKDSTAMWSRATIFLYVVGKVKQQVQHTHKIWLIRFIGPHIFEVRFIQDTFQFLLT